MIALAQNIKVTLGKIHHQLLELHMLGSKEIHHELFLAITELHIDTHY